MKPDWHADSQLLDEKEQAGHLRSKAELVTSHTATQSAAGKAAVVLEEEMGSRLQHATREPTHLLFQTQGAHLLFLSPDSGSPGRSADPLPQLH